MENKGLVKKISKCLGVLAFSTLIGSGICYAKEMNPSGYAIPDLSEASLCDKGYTDLTNKIAGNETYIELYTTAKEDYVWKASINDKVFYYQIADSKTKKVYGIADTDGDGIFETKYDETEIRGPKEDGIFRKEIPPEWVLK